MTPEQYQQATVDLSDELLQALELALAGREFRLDMLTQATGLAVMKLYLMLGVSDRLIEVAATELADFLIASIGELGKEEPGDDGVQAAHGRVSDEGGGGEPKGSRGASPPTSNEHHRDGGPTASGGAVGESDT